MVNEQFKINVLENTQIENYYYYYLPYAQGRVGSLVSIDFDKLAHGISPSCSIFDQSIELAHATRKTNGNFV